jgi:hypothetical protein
MTDFDDPALRRLARTTVPADAREPFGAYIFAVSDPGADLARHLEQAVFLEAFGNTPDLLKREYGKYEHSSFFICVVDHLRHVPAGMMRVLTPSPAGFKSLDDIEPVWGLPADELVERTGISLDARCTWDIATLAVAKDYRRGASGGLVTMALYQSLTLAALHCGIEWFIAILDMPVFRIIRWRLRMIFAGYDGIGPLPYLGSAASLPAWCDVLESERRLAAEDEDLYAVLVRGEGLEPALRRVDLGAADRYVVRPGEAVMGGPVSS